LTQNYIVWYPWIMKQRMEQKICKFCGEVFTLQINHKGLINVCLDSDCQRELRLSGVHEPPPITANVSWENKHTPLIELVYCPQLSASFNATQRRHGVGVGRHFTNPSVTPAKRIAGKDYEAPEKQAGQLWRSSLGEAHHTKR